MSPQDVAAVFDAFMSAPWDSAYSEKADLIQQLFVSSHSELISGLLQSNLPFDRLYDHGLNRNKILERFYLAPIRAASLPSIFQDLTVNHLSHGLISQAIVDWMKRVNATNLLVDPTVIATLLRGGVRFHCQHALQATRMTDDQIAAVFPLLHWIDGPGFSPYLTESLLTAAGNSHLYFTCALMKLPQVRHHLRQNFLGIPDFWMPALFVVAFVFDPVLFELMANTRCSPDSPQTLVHRLISRAREEGDPDRFQIILECLMDKGKHHPLSFIGRHVEDDDGIDWTDDYLEELFRVATLTTIAHLIDCDSESFVRGLSSQGRCQIDSKIIDVIQTETLAFVQRLHGIWTRYPDQYGDYLQDYNMFIAEPAQAAL